jgi:hypothetical protein
MRKTVDWSKIIVDKKPTIGVVGGESVRSYREVVKEKVKSYEESLRVEKMIKSLLPAMEQELMRKLISHEPIKVIRPIQYMTQVLEKGGRMGFAFVDEPAILQSGTELIFKCLEKQTQTMLFSDSSGNEIELSLNCKQQLLLNTDIYTNVVDSLEG